MNRIVLYSLYSVAVTGSLAALAVQGREPAESQSSNVPKAVKSAPETDNAESTKAEKG